MNEREEFVLQCALQFIGKYELNGLLYPPVRRQLIESAVTIGVELLAEAEKQLKKD